MAPGLRSLGAEQAAQQSAGLSSGATRAKKENDSMPESPGPREDRQACPGEGRHSLAFIHGVPVPPSVPLDSGVQSCLGGRAQTLSVGFPCPGVLSSRLDLCSGGTDWALR